MIDRLFVVIGAGASYDCVPTDKGVPRNDRLHPPLTADLFTNRRAGYAPILAKYPLAKAAAAELSTAESAVSLETQLRERYRDSEHGHDRRIFRGVLPYLQELLYTISYEYTPFPQNYEVLVTKLLRLNEIVFISLNYDLLLDNALLAVDQEKGGMGWYVRGARNWSLIKLHGSVDWGRRILTASPRDEDFSAPSAEMTLASEIALRGEELFRIRGFFGKRGAHRGELYFPALAVPVGEADELVCPPDHVAFLKRRLSETQPMHLLVIGYSGLDREVVSLIRESERGVKTLTVVDRDPGAARDVVERLAAQGISAQSSKVTPNGFSAWVQSGGLDRFVGEMSQEPF